jgi:flagellar basal body rod protein FlgG
MKEIFHLLAGAVGQEQRLTQLAHNMANVNTPGFRQDQAAFVDFFAQAMAAQGGGEAASAQANPAAVSWPVLAGNFVDPTPGPIRPTGAPLDAAIVGDGFFQVQVEGQPGVYLTRAGNFTVNAQRELVTQSGHRVLDRGGQSITIDATQGTATIGADGQVRVAGQPVGELGIVRVADPTRLGRYGEGMFIPRAEDAPTAVDQPALRAGALEGSNVNPIAMMIEMIETERAYQSHQKTMQAIDELVARRIEAAR